MRDPTISPLPERTPSPKAGHPPGTRSPTLLEPGHEQEWARLNAQKRKALTPPPGTPVEELLRRGQALSAQVAWLREAVERGRESDG